MAAKKKRRGQQRRRGRFGFLYKLLSAALIFAAIFAGCVVFFRVDTVSVAGNSRYTAPQIIEAAEVERGDNLFLLNKSKIYRQILTRLPYVDSVNLHLRLPDGLDLTVTECAAAAALQGEGAWWVVNAGGKFLERTDAAGAAGLAPITGLTSVAPIVGTKLETPEEQEQKRESLVALMRAVDARGLTPQVRSYDLTADNVILVGYADRFTLKLPMSGANYDYLMHAVEEAVGNKLSESDSGELDLSRAESEGVINLIPYS